MCQQAISTHMALCCGSVPDTQVQVKQSGLKVWLKFIFSASVFWLHNTFIWMFYTTVGWFLTKVHPCRPLRASLVQILSRSCGNLSSLCVLCRCPTALMSLCRLSTQDHQRNDMAEPAGGVCWRPAGFCWGSGICNPHWKKRKENNNIKIIF